jgi:hypothetical protein
MLWPGLVPGADGQDTRAIQPLHCFYGALFGFDAGSVQRVWADRSFLEIVPFAKLCYNLLQHGMRIEAV